MRKSKTNLASRITKLENKSGIKSHVDDDRQKGILDLLERGKEYIDNPPILTKEEHEQMLVELQQLLDSQPKTKKRDFEI